MKHSIGFPSGRCWAKFNEKKKNNNWIHTHRNIFEYNFCDVSMKRPEKPTSATVSFQSPYWPWMMQV